MSSIVLSNPFATPPPTAQAAMAVPQTALAVAPSTETASNPNAGNAGGSGGHGSGFHSHGGQQAIIRLAAIAGHTGRAPDATSGSVINAQARSEGDSPFGINLPEVEMPDPLPTSPFLTSTKVKDPLALLRSLG